jgi:hypothetical protein
MLTSLFLMENWMGALLMVGPGELGKARGGMRAMADRPPYLA